MGDSSSRPACKPFGPLAVFYRKFFQKSNAFTLVGIRFLPATVPYSSILEKRYLLKKEKRVIARKYNGEFLQPRLQYFCLEKYGFKRRAFLLFFFLLSKFQNWFCFTEALPKQNPLPQFFKPARQFSDCYYTKPA